MKEIKMVLMRENVLIDNGSIITKEIILNSLNTFAGMPIILINKDENKKEVGVINYPIEYINNTVIGNVIYYEDKYIKNEYDDWEIDTLNLLIGGDSFMYQCCKIYE